MIWQQLRTPFLAITCVGLVSIFAKLVADPTLGKPTAYTFPAVVPLSGWQPRVSLTAVKTQAAQDKQLLSKSKSYRYTQKNSHQLDVNMHYIVGTSGDGQLFVRKYTSIPLDSKQLVPVTRYQKGIGYYELLSDRSSAHLVACINPRGESTVTRKQFLHNRHTYDLQLSNILLWLTTKSDLRDRRCLWTHLSMPLNQAPTQEQAYRQLETTWISLYRWWAPRFPPI